MEAMLTMQDALRRLSDYWQAQGCAVLQPINTEVGAGTLNPATSLRVLGPERWNAVYVEPSVRPDDSRYGDNPNRVQTHTQLQVIMKPEPGDPQELYLGSLAAIDIDVRAHDIRFVEDNWAAPAIGAWGLGWEVWLDGMEITQFTYFQQLGGVNLDPVPVEITYGIERIMMSLQNVDHFKKIAYTDTLSYGELFGQSEYEWSRYYLDGADVAGTQATFDFYAAEANRLIEAKLPIPAHSCVLKCSHAFNIMDSRGAVSTTMRARAFAEMRRLAHAVAELWIVRREEEGHPLGDARSGAAPLASATTDWRSASTPATAVLEIGVEELPAAEVSRISAIVAEDVGTQLGATRLPHGAVTVGATPRRIVITVAEVHPQEAAQTEVVRGPKISAAFDSAGAPTKAAEGFARKFGGDVAALTRTTVDGTEYLAAERHDDGRPAAQVLTEVFTRAVKSAQGQRNMRWVAPAVSFSRPVRWLLALHGADVLPVTLSTLTAGRTTRLLRTAEPGVAEIAHADELVSTLAAHQIVVETADRRAAIVSGAAALAAAVGGEIDLTLDAATVDEVANLVEYPTPLVGHFDERYLELPDEVLVTVMKKHQRYLPIRRRVPAGPDGGAGATELLPHFVAVANADCDVDTVRRGNESVIRARFEDARFFYDEDLQTPLADLRKELESLAFEERLGSVADRASRIAALAQQLSASVELSGPEQATLQRAGELVKFDLGSRMVVEMTSLAGLMAREYARHAGEPEPVAQALYESEQPRAAGGQLPASTVGALLSLADRLDLISGLLAVGVTVTGSSDPFGLRRSALGVLAVLESDPRLDTLDLDTALRLAAAGQPVAVDEAALVTTRQFVDRRFEQRLVDAGFAADVVRAVLPLAARPRIALAYAEQLTESRGQADFDRVVNLMQRVARIVRSVNAGSEVDEPYEPTLAADPHEQALAAAVAGVGYAAHGADDLGAFATAVLPLAAPTEAFFDQVLVLSEDAAERLNRLRLLRSISRLSPDELDWLALERLERSGSAGA